MLKVFYTAVYSLLLLGLSAQSIDSTLILGERLYSQERYGEAIYYFERVRFFNPVETSNEVLFKMGECYRKGGKPQQSLAYYDRVYINSNNDYLKQEALLSKVQSLVSLKEFVKALAEIYASAPTDSDQASRFSFYEGVCYFARENFEDAYHAFIRASGSDSLKISAVNQLYSDTSMLYRPRPKLAKKLSYFLPGLGQFYAGDYKNGVNSILLNTALMALAVNVGVTYSFLDALVSVFPWIQRYYIGGTDKAKLIAQKQRLLNRQKFYLELIAIFDPNTTGPKAQP